MLRTMLAGLAMATAFTGSALAAGPLSVTTDFPSPIVPSDPFKADLESIGVGVELAAPTLVDVFSDTNLTFRLLQSQVTGSGVQITSLTVDGVKYEFGLQDFTSPGTLLGSQLFSGAFTGQVGFNDLSDPEGAPITWPEAFQVYIRTTDEADLSGIGPFIGNFDTLYFSIAGAALFEVTSVSGVIPEPATWALLIAGFGLAGAALRRRPVPA